MYTFCDITEKQIKNLIALFYNLIKNWSVIKIENVSK